MLSVKDQFSDGSQELTGTGVLPHRSNAADCRAIITPSVAMTLVSGAASRSERMMPRWITTPIRAETAMPTSAPCQVAKVGSILSPCTVNVVFVRS